MATFAVLGATAVVVPMAVADQSSFNTWVTKLSSGAGVGDFAQAIMAMPAFATRVD
jgi:hypothetical protein